MARVEKSVTLNVPAADCYRLWTDMEDYPRFMTHVRRITRQDHTNIYHWEREDAHGRSLSWDVQVDTLEPYRMIAWHTLNDTVHPHSVVVLFHALEPTTTRIDVIMTYPDERQAEFVQDLSFNPYTFVSQALDNFVVLAEGRTPYYRTAPGCERPGTTN